MIGVSSSNKSFRVLARYLSEGRTGEEQNRVAWVASRNLPTDDPELAARIMRATAGQNVRVKEPVYHLALSFDPGDAVDRAAMERVADHVLETLGLQEHQVLIVAHADREHAHMHLMVNRVHPETGKVWSRWQDYPAIQRVLREEEEALGLRRVPGRSSERSASGGEVTKGLADDLQMYERLVEVGRERYNGELEVAAAQARLARLDAAAERARRALDTLKGSLHAMYRDTEHALASFLAAAGREPAAAVRDLRDMPERFGELLTPGGRTTARTAAAAGREVIDAERAFRVAIANARNGRRRQAGSPGVDGSDQEPADAQGAVRADLERIQVSLRKLRDEEQRMPGRHLLERTLARGLWELSPPEFNRLRLVVTGAQFSLARKLRQMAQDVALGRDDEM
jgi:Relaxase/Mobilisation nuclease domain